MMNRRNLLIAGATATAAVSSLSTSALALSAKDFGIKPNKPRDQTKKIQKAINAAIKSGGELHLPAGIYIAHGLTIDAGVVLRGVGGLTRLVLSQPADYLLAINNATKVTLDGITFDGANNRLTSGDTGALVMATNTSDLTIENCYVQNSTENGIALEKCSGRIVHSTIKKCGTGGIYSLDASGSGLEIGHNHVSDIGDNGIMVWQSKKRQDGTIVHHNHIEKIHGKSGGNGQYGNGVGIYRAGNVTVTGNRITDCQFSAVRDNGGDNVIVTDNNCSRLNEVGIFIEFGFQGAIVSGNMVEKAGMGISITNYNEGGRLAVCANNVVRDMLGAISNPDTQAIGIAVEADTAVTGNTIENAKRCGIWMGWGKYMRDVTATGNVIRGCDIGVSASVVKGAKGVLIANNLISGAVQSIAGMDHDKIITKDLASARNKAPKGFMVTGNMVS